MKIKIAIVDSRISPEEERRLLILGYRVLTLPPFSRLSSAVASHVDMLLTKIGDDYISYADYCEEASYVFTDLSLLLRGSGAVFSFTADEAGSEYPNDCRLNALRMGNKLFCRTESASEYLIAAAKRSRLEIVSVKQGYPACTVLKLSDTDAITADRGMAKVLTSHGIKVTLIENGSIALPPHEYGFIGGAGTVYDGNLYLLGNIELHPQSELIKKATSSLGLGIISLSGEPLVDLGGIIFAEADVN